MQEKRVQEDPETSTADPDSETKPKRGRRVRHAEGTTALTADPLAGLTIGRSIHFCYERPNPEGTTVELVHRAAFVVNVEDRDAGTIELAWLPAQSDGVAPFVRVYGCPYSAEPLKGSWHWIERAE